MIEELSSEQNARVAALTAARDVLSEQTKGPFVNKTMTADTFDLVSIASWIIDGKDPWEPKKFIPSIEEIILKPEIYNKDKT